jgi:CubicO group peptidase (beta-lactamase class C family)
MHIRRSVVLVSTLSLILVFPFYVTAQEKSHVTSEQVTHAIQELEKLARKQIQENAVPGLAIAIVFQDKVVYAKGFGVRDVNTKTPVDAETVFQLASVSKPIGSTVVAELVGEGKITWDSKLSVLDPTFAMFDPWVTHEITIRDMYAHRSGLPEHAGDLLEDLGFTRGEILYHLRYQHPGSSFRSHYAYSNFGMTEGGIAAAKAYGQEWEEASEQRLYKPLGMNSTSSRYADFVARQNKALGHVLVDGKWVQKFKRDPDAQSPTGGVSSSVDDVANGSGCSSPMESLMASRSLMKKRWRRRIIRTCSQALILSREYRASTGWDGTSATMSRVGCG